MNEDLKKRLETYAYQKSTAFCYLCYCEAPTGHCPMCQGDDLMRFVVGEGVEYGIEWVIESLISSNLTPANTEEAFEESIRGCYPETVQVGWLTLDTVDTIKDMDPISWNCAKSEWESFEEQEGNLVTVDNGATYYWLHDVEILLNTE
jgi:hypothetical protein